MISQDELQYFIEYISALENQNAELRRQVDFLLSERLPPEQLRARAQSVDRRLLTVEDDYREHCE